MNKPKVETPSEGNTNCTYDLYDAPIPQDKEAVDSNMAKMAQANLDRFGLNVDKFTDRPRPTGRET